MTASQLPASADARSGTPSSGSIVLLVEHVEERERRAPAGPRPGVATTTAAIVPDGAAPASTVRDVGSR